MTGKSQDRVASVKSSILVRLGNETWETGTSHSITTSSTDHERTSRLSSSLPVDKHISLKALRREAREKAASEQLHVQQTRTNPLFRFQRIIAPTDESRSSFKGLRGGLIVGMILGCLAMFLFHQMVSNVPLSTSANHQSSGAPSTQKTSTVNAMMQSKSFNLPGFHLYLTSLGSFSGQMRADQARTKFKQQGLSTTVVPLNGAYQLVSAAFVNQTDAKQALTKSKNQTSHMTVVEWTNNARSIPVLASATKQDVQTTEMWISEANSALLSTTAWLSDAGRISDANTALQTAVNSYPGASALSNLGLTSDLSGLRGTLLAMQQDIKQKNQSALSEDVMTAFQQIAQLQGVEKTV